MSVTTDPSKIINKNDNSPVSWLQNLDKEIVEKRAPYIPLANWLIEKHCPKDWKNYPACAEYQSAQMMICAHLECPADSLQWTLRFISFELQCSPITLMNDQSPEVRNIPSFSFSVCPLELSLRHKLVGPEHPSVTLFAGS